MTFFRTTRLLTVAALCALSVLTPRAQAADNGGAQKKDAQTVLNELRVKKWTKDLTLTTEQQTKVQALFDAEGKEIAKLDAAQTLTPAERSAKVRELHEVTYSKMKPLLTATQLEAFEKILARTSKPKQAKPAAGTPQP